MCRAVRLHWELQCGSPHKWCLWFGCSTVTSPDHDEKLHKMVIFIRKRMRMMVVIMMRAIRRTDRVRGGRLKNAISQSKLPIRWEAKSVQLSWGWCWWGELGFSEGLRRVAQAEGPDGVWRSLGGVRSCHLIVWVPLCGCHHRQQRQPSREEERVWRGNAHRTKNEDAIKRYEYREVMSEKDMMRT